MRFGISVTTMSRSPIADADAKAMKEEIRQADKKLETNQKAIKAIMGKIKKIKLEGDSVLTKDTGSLSVNSIFNQQTTTFPTKFI